MVDAALEVLAHDARNHRETAVNYHTRASELLQTGVVGTQNQRERQQAKLLPDDELFEAVRDYLFRPIAELPRWVRIDKYTIKERALARGEASESDTVHIETLPADALDAAQWEKRATIARQLGIWFEQNKLDVELEISDHWLVVHCGNYQKRYTKLRISARFCNVDHVREVAL